MKYIIFIFSSLCLICLANSSYSQGCVGVRHMTCSAIDPTSANTLFSKKQGTFMVNASYRYFKSFRHFRGDEQEKNRVADGTQVINLSHSLDLGVSYIAANRWTFTAAVPILYFDRSSLYEHYGNSLSSNPNQERFHTKSAGIGDLRLSASYWLKNPMEQPKDNIALGLGIKFATGNPGVIDEFHKLNAQGQDYTIVKPVDQSIQLGDGAIGGFVDVQGYKMFGDKTSLYYNAFYLFTPAEVNDVERNPGSEGDPIIQYFSVPDQFLARVGVNHSVKAVNGLGISLGVRAEGIPSKDVIGGSNGYRRPGYIISAEPGITYMKNKYVLAVNVPIAAYRNRTRSTYDLADPTGQRHGDAAFADYTVNFSLTKWF